MVNKASIENATVNILIELAGEIHLVAMEKDKYDAVTLITKASADTLIKTGRTQWELNEFLNYKSRGR